MHTFTFVAGRPGLLTRSRLLSHARIVRSLLPSLETRLQSDAFLRPEEGFGWSSLIPGTREGESLLSQAITSDHAAVAYGQVQCPADGAGGGTGTGTGSGTSTGSGTGAQRLLGRWLEGGAEAVQELEGSFSAVVVERSTGEVHLLCDLLGHRALRFFATDQEIIASPHDLAIAATGRSPAGIDHTSAATILACEWSLGGRSMLEGVEICAPGEVVRWRAGVGTPDRTLFLPGARPADASGGRGDVAEVRSRMLAVAVESTRLFLQEEPDPVVDLTAGLDSRAALALVLGAGNWQGRRVQCAGAEDSLDVRYGRRIADREGLRFIRTEPTLPTAEKFLEHVDLMAFAMNGDTNGKRALAPAPTYPARRLPHVWGGGGEIYRGYYYPPAGRSPGLRSNADAARLLHSKLHVDRLPWRDPTFAEAVHRRQDERLDRLATAARGPYDLLDLYYLFERFAVWGSIKERFTWEPDRYWTPFANARLVRLGFRLPAPLGTRTRLHTDAIRRFLPGAYWVPVNGATILPFERLGAPGRALNRAYRVAGRLVRRLPGSEVSSSGARSHEQLRAEIFAGPLSDTLAAILDSRDSLSAELLGHDGIRGILASHRAAAGIQTLQVLGRLVTMERWHQMARSARAAAENEWGAST